MGGNAFTDTKPITLEEFINLMPVLQIELDILGASRVIGIGSTGKVDVMGDIDLAVEHPKGRDFLCEHLGKLYGEHSVKKYGSRQLSVRYPNIDDTRYVQLDMIVGPPGSSGWLWWAHYSPGMAPIKGRASGIWALRGW